MYKQFYLNIKNIIHKELYIGFVKIKNFFESQRDEYKKEKTTVLEENICIHINNKCIDAIK